MKAEHTSIFNLIQIFSQPSTKKGRKPLEQTYCETKQHHDYYCDAEKPFISI